MAKIGLVRPGRGRNSSIASEKIDEVVRLTQQTKPAGEDALELPVDGQSGRGEPRDGAADRSGRGLKPHLVKPFKLSSDKRFEEKLVDVVGL